MGPVSTTPPPPKRRSAGRPPMHAVRMMKMLRIRLADEEYEQIADYCDENNVDSMSEAVRDALFATGVLKRVS
jgi:hypothetical protein